MNIKPAVYESLTPRQRVIATIEAEARGDDDEVNRLVKTCPKKTYSQADAAYTDTMIKLWALSAAIECDIRGNIIGFLVSVLMERESTVDIFLQRIANTQAAWDEMLNGIGIDPDSMSKAGIPPHPIFEIIAEHIPSADVESANLYVETLLSCLPREIN